VTYLLDTDTLEHFQRSNIAVLRRAAAIGADNLAISVITRIELLHARFEYLRKAANGAQLQNAQHWLSETDRLLEQWRTLAVNEAACREFDVLRGRKGFRRIGRSDLLIACIALAYQAVLVTRNVRDFTNIPGLTVENWCD
jgi:tRNA(fMet)-specific endonuclease VapC